MLNATSDLPYLMNHNSQYQERPDAMPYRICKVVIQRISVFKLQHPKPKLKRLCATHDPSRPLRGPDATTLRGLAISKM